MIKGVKAAVAVALVAGLLTACDDNSAPVGGKGPVGMPEQKTPTDVALRVPAAVPPGYDSTRGWQSGLQWAGDDILGYRTPLDIAPRAGLVAMLQKQGDGYVLEARDTTSGALRFRSKALDVPQEPEPDETEREIPGVAVVTQGGKEYVTVWAHGFRGKDAVQDGEEVVSVAVFTAGARGEAVVPATAVDVPVGHRGITRLGGRRMTDFVTARDGGAGLLVTWVPEDAGEVAASVDVTTGEVRRYSSTSQESECERIACEETWVEALSEHGPVRSHYTGAFGVAGRWTSNQFVPQGATKNGYGRYSAEILAAGKGRVIAAWEAYDPAASVLDAERIWAVHDAATGAVQASVRCDEQVWRSLDDKDRVVSVSPGGRYLTAGYLAFDLEQGTGHCLFDKEGQQPVETVSVDDQGTVYGLAGWEVDSDRALASVSMATGKAKALPAGTDLPLHILPKAAVFFPIADGGGMLPTVHPRR